jgi:hypothetical protein
VYSQLGMCDKTAESDQLNYIYTLSHSQIAGRLADRRSFASTAN